ncbi:MAG: oligosaccharide flippase family protein [Bacteroidetes bacterium]|nr:oligosaccharide flippase family protein [Bacteroidota bacterium]
MMQKKFIINLAILISLNLLVKPFWILIIEPAVQYKVGNEAYGEYFALFNFSFLLNILLDFGITNFNNKNIAQNNHLLEKHFSGLFLLKLMLGVVYIIVTLSIGLAIGYNFRYLKLLFLLGFNQFLISMILYLRSNLLGLHAFKADSLISVLDRSIMIIICGVLLWTGFTGIYIDVMNFVYAQTIAYLFTAILAFWVVLRKTETFSLSWNRPFFIMILKKSFPFAVLVLLMTFYNRLDAVMIEKLLPEGEGAEQTGIYAKGFRLLDAANMIAYLLSLQLLPIFSRMIKHKENVEGIVKLSFTLLITAAIISTAISWFYQVELISLINHGVTDSATIFSMLMTCFIAISSTYIFGTLLTANGNLKQLNIMALLGICLNFSLNLILIPSYKAMGAAYSSLVTQFFTAGAQVYLSYRIFKFRINYRLIFTLLVFSIGVTGIGFLCKYFFNNYLIGIGLMCIFSGMWALLTKLISLKSIIRFAKS